MTCTEYYARKNAGLKVPGKSYEHYRQLQRQRAQRAWAGR